MGQKSGSAGSKAGYTRYKAESRLERNKRKKMERHFKNHPNASREGQGGGGVRKAPNSRTAFSSREVKEFAHTLRLVSGSAKAIHAILALKHTVYDHPAKDRKG